MAPKKSKQSKNIKPKQSSRLVKLDETNTSSTSDLACNDAIVRSCSSSEALLLGGTRRSNSSSISIGAEVSSSISIGAAGLLSSLGNDSDDLNFSDEGSSLFSPPSCNLSNSTTSSVSIRSRTKRTRTPESYETEDSSQSKSRKSRKVHIYIRTHVSMSALAINKEAFDLVMSYPHCAPYLEKMEDKIVMIKVMGATEDMEDISEHYNIIVAFMLHIMCVEGITATHVFKRATDILTGDSTIVPGERCLQRELVSTMSRCQDLTTNFTRICDNWKTRLRVLPKKFLFKSLINLIDYPDGNEDPPYLPNFLRSVK